LRKLVGYGLLEDSLEKDSWNRDMEVFSITKGYNPNEKLEMPTYEELCRNTEPPKTPKLPITPIIPKLPNQKEQTEGGTLGTLGTLGKYATNNSAKPKDYPELDVKVEKIE